MQNRADLYTRISLKAYGIWLTAYGSCRPFRHRRKGQATVEYLLMLAVVVGVTLAVGGLFYKTILGGLFSVVGMVLGAGKVD